MLSCAHTVAHRKPTGSSLPLLLGHQAQESVPPARRVAVEQSAGNGEPLAHTGSPYRESRTKPEGGQ